MTITLFSWGFYGWGSSARAFIKAADKVEASRGYRPPYFVEIRLRRSGRAPQFAGNSFEEIAGNNRYRWMPSLGNAALNKKGGPGVLIKNPAAAFDLLNLARQLDRKRQRVIFFCGCQLPCECHRRAVTSLLLRAARKQRIKVEIAEWPGGQPTGAFQQSVSETQLKAIRRNGHANIRLGQRIPAVKLLALPWKSIAKLSSSMDSVSAVVDAPRRTRLGWCLPVVDWDETMNVGVLRRRAAAQRKKEGFEIHRV